MVAINQVTHPLWSMTPPIIMCALGNSPSSEFMPKGNEPVGLPERSWGQIKTLRYKWAQPLLKIAKFKLLHACKQQQEGMLILGPRQESKL